MRYFFYVSLLLYLLVPSTYAQRVTRHIYPPVDFYGKVKPIKYECEPMVNQINLTNISPSSSWEKGAIITWHTAEGATKHTGTHQVLSPVAPGEKKIIPVPGIPDYCRAEISYTHLPIHDKVKN